MGLLRQNLIVELGLDRAREFFLRFGYQNGFSDFRQMKTTVDYDSETELLAMGPIVHTWEGIVKAVPTDLAYDRKKREVPLRRNMEKLIRGRTASGLQYRFR